MNTTTAPRKSELPRPLYYRVALKWYSWAGLALTLTASYLAFDGQLKFGPVSQLQAAPPPTADVSWKSSQSGDTVSGPALPTTTLTSGQVGTQAPIPDIFSVTPSQSKLAPGVGSVLTDYASGGKSVVQAQFQNPGGEDPKIPIPAIPQQSPDPGSKTMPALEEVPGGGDPAAMPAGPSLIGLPPSTKPDPGTPPPVPKVNLPVAPRRVNCR